MASLAAMGLVDSPWGKRCLRRSRELLLPAEMVMKLCLVLSAMVFGLIFSIVGGLEAQPLMGETVSFAAG